MSRSSSPILGESALRRVPAARSPRCCHSPCKRLDEQVTEPALLQIVDDVCICLVRECAAPDHEGTPQIWTGRLDESTDSAEALLFAIGPWFLAPVSSPSITSTSVLGFAPPDGTGGHPPSPAARNLSADASDVRDATHCPAVRRFRPSAPAAPE
jgi:hypothetical protein